jgi:uncharacterized membrane protein
MEKKGMFPLFWSVLATINVLAMSYPVVLFRRAVSMDAQLLATLLMIGCLFLVIVIDAVSILMAAEFDELKRGTKHTQRAWITTRK